MKTLFKNRKMRYSVFILMHGDSQGNMSGKKGAIIDIVIFGLIAVIIYFLIFVPQPAPIAPSTQISSQSFGFEELPDPVQTPYRGGGSIPYTDKNINLQIVPKANYRIYAMVMGKHGYSWDWDSKLAPYDLALAWNQLMLPQYQQGISYSQGNRWYYFHYKAGYPLSESYIYKHSANTHMIPANPNLKKALDVIKKGDKVYFEGYLVSINGKVNGGDVWWHSSLSRDDTGDGACEVFYFTKAVVDNMVYQ